jgi:putative acetyltransferase
MARAIEVAERRGAAAIVLVGHPSYYPRFGFEPARPVGLEPPGAWPDPPWMVRRLSAWHALDRPATVRFAAAFPAT